MIYNVTIGDRAHLVSVRKSTQGWLVSVDEGPEVSYGGTRVGVGEWMLKEGARARAVGVHADHGSVRLQIDGHPLIGRVLDPRRASLEMAGSGENQLTTSMPGVVVRVLVKVGDVVKAGQVLLVVEAMKMENEFKAPCDGMVEAIPINEGDVLAAGALLVSIAQE
ncbi:MAG: biotin/lipoyl-binding protein [Proteobacteria bacterium]|jgi:biotin carboxyl carrier protein|nr:biotin/lipoyl-binding protein [Pseudomonadota bacterium]